MNRREAIRAVMAMPGVASISVAQLKPDDVIVLECDEIVSDHVAAYLKSEMQQIWPGRKVAVLCKGLHLKVVREGS